MTSSSVGSNCRILATEKSTLTGSIVPLVVAKLNKARNASGRIQGEIHRYVGDASVGPLWCELPGVQLDPPAWRRPVALRPLIEAGVVGQHDLPSAGAQDDPWPLGVVLGHAVGYSPMRTYVRIASSRAPPEQTVRASISSIVARPRLWQRRCTGDPVEALGAASGCARTDHRHHQRR
jgi:hypothetical protein